MSTVPQSQYEQLMGDFTTMNLQLNETRNKLYDAQQQAAALQATLKTTQAEFTKSAKQLRRARRTIDRSKDKKSLEQALGENSDLQEQLAAMKRVVRKMQEEGAARKEEEERLRKEKEEKLRMEREQIEDFKSKDRLTLELMHAFGCFSGEANAWKGNVAQCP